MDRTHTLSGVVFGIGVIVLLASPAGAETYYVNGACGNDAWTGTSPVCAAPSGPKQSIGAAVAQTLTGDEVVVADGTYSQSSLVLGKAITLRSSGGAAVCILDGAGSNRLFSISDVDAGTPVRILGMTLRNGSADLGGAIRVLNSDVELIDCIVADNTAQIGGAIRQGGGSLLLRGCVFERNVASEAAGGVGVFAGLLQVVNCRFTDNASGAIGGIAVSGQVDIVNTFFARNDGDFLGGAGAATGLNSITNCTFSRNDADRGGGWVLVDTTTFGSCTFSHNLGEAIYNDPGPAHVRNSISWGNDPVGLIAASITYSDVEGGAAGQGNIDADPLFASPASDDVHLTLGSPCVDAGRNEDLPADTFDLDGDGDTTETVPYDLDGNRRIDGKSVDMGAYEGAGETQDATATEPDLDQGEVVALVPGGGPLDPVNASAGVVVNVSGPNNQTFSLTQILWDLHPQARGYTEMGDILSSQTTLDDGQFVLIAFIAFDAETLGGIDPTTLDMTAYDPLLGDWVLAVSRNTQNSPGHEGPVGDRSVLVGTEWTVSSELGDYGVFWNPLIEQGFAWARVDRAGDLAFGLPTCLGDCAPVDGKVGAADLLALLSQWGAPGTCDLNGDGVVGAFDLAAILADVWGLCTAPALPLPPSAPRGSSFPIPAGAADLTGDGRVDRADLDGVKAAWGVCPKGDCPADLDRDGTVGTSDLLAVLAQWGGP